MQKVRAAEASITVNADAKTVWHALTTPSSLKKFFFGADVKTSWDVGSPITFSGEFKGKPYVDKGEIKNADTNKKLSFTHLSGMSGDDDKPENYHLLTITLAPKQGATEVTLTQDNQNGKPVSEKASSEFEKNWEGVLQGLKKTVES
jgi:uncharacterized protein YndB with AHSA1/START domain